MVIVKSVKDEADSGRVIIYTEEADYPRLPSLHLGARSCLKLGTSIYLGVTGM